VHRDRALAAGHAGAIRWEAMTVEERQAIGPDEVFDLWIHWERAAMIEDDVRALPRSPAVVAEGTTVPAEQSPAVWLNRPSAWPRSPVFRRFADAIVDAGERSGVAVVENEGPLEETIHAVEEHFGDALFRAPRSETLEERRGLLREANDALAFQVRTGSARPWATWDLESVTRNFLCECDDPECREMLVLPVAEFERRARTAPVTS
jgi:hypothetical protein